jgi:hypothetical protein
LNHGTWFQDCEVPGDVTLSVCAAVRDGRPHGVTIATRPPRPALHDCVARGAMRLRFPRQPAMDLTRTVFLAEGLPPWGAPIAAADEEARVLDFVRAVAAQPARARRSLADIVVAMPGLWRRLTSADPALDNVGIEAVMLKEEQEITMRTLLEEHQIASLVASPAFTELSAQLARGQTRPATVTERRRTWELQATEFLPDTPITIAQAGELRVAFLVSEGRIWWMEVLADPASSPFTSAAP